MPDGMVKYESYKDSGIDWIGDISTEWDVQPLRSIFEFRNEKNDPVKTENILSLSIAHGVTPYSEEGRGGNKRKDDLTAYKLAYPNDIVLNSMNVIVGAVGLSNYFGAISPVYYALKPKPQRANVNFYAYVFQNQSFLSGLLRYGKGIMMKLSGTGKLNTIRMKISTNDLKQVKFPVPDLDTQNRIVKFLDEKTAEIDAAVGKKRRLIDLLNEQKAILINRAVTKGLNPAAPMKDSGVDWIGEIPAHWDVKRFKHCVRTQSGQVDPTRSPYKEMILIAPNHIVQGTGETLAFETADEQGADSGKYFANAGCIIYSKIRPKLNKACIVDFDALCSADMYALQGYPEYFTQQYLLRQILSECFVIPAVDASMRVAMPKVNREAMAEFPMIIPPKPEQEEIVSWLDARLADVRAPEKATLREIATLNEFKQTLIANAVTGKIKI